MLESGDTQSDSRILVANNGGVKCGYSELFAAARLILWLPAKGRYREWIICSISG